MQAGMRMKTVLAAGLCGLIMTACTGLLNAPGNQVSAAEARAIAKEAWLYGYAPIQGYQTFYSQALNTQAPGYVGGLNTFRHYSRTYTPQDAEIVTPNNDTPYSWAWLDLRAEPIVLSLPSVPAPRYYVNQWFDLYTHNFAYTGVRATGRESGNYLFAGPRWKGEVPPGITRVYRAETDIVGTLTRTQLNGPADVSTLQALQAQYRLIPLSEYAGLPKPPASPALSMPAWDKEKAEGIGFIAYLNAMLPLMPTVPSEKAAMERFAKIGIAPGKPFDPASLSPELRTAIEQGVQDATKQLTDTAMVQKDSKKLFGTREQLGDDYVMNRSLGAMLGIYGNTKEEAVYASQQTDPEGKLLDGNRKWLLRFPAGQLPPADLFWSITMYNLPQRLLVDNPLNRYSIGDRSPGLKKNADGSMDIYLQSTDPGGDKTSNWLPTPKGPFFFVARFYGPRSNLIDGSWSLPPLVELK
jgi:hypothetical protein